MTVAADAVRQAKAYHKITRHELVVDDYQAVRKLVVRLDKDGGWSRGGHTFRHVIVITDQKWFALSKSQREQLWVRIEHHVMQRAASV